jgi:hypothetical protein
MLVLLKADSLEGSVVMDNNNNGVAAGERRGCFFGNQEVVLDRSSSGLVSQSTLYYCERGTYLTNSMRRAHLFLYPKQ